MIQNWEVIVKILSLSWLGLMSVIVRSEPTYWSAQIATYTPISRDSASVYQDCMNWMCRTIGSTSKNFLMDQNIESICQHNTQCCSGKNRDFEIEQSICYQKCFIDIKQNYNDQDFKILQECRGRCLDLILKVKVFSSFEQQLEYKYYAEYLKCKEKQCNSHIIDNKDDIVFTQARSIFSLCQESTLKCSQAKQVYNMTSILFECLHQCKVPTLNDLFLQFVACDQKCLETSISSFNGYMTDLDQEIQDIKTPPDKNKPLSIEFWTTLSVGLAFLLGFTSVLIYLTNIYNRHTQQQLLFKYQFNLTQTDDDISEDNELEQEDDDDENPSEQNQYHNPDQTNQLQKPENNHSHKDHQVQYQKNHLDLQTNVNEGQLNNKTSKRTNGLKISDEDRSRLERGETIRQDLKISAQTHLQQMNRILSKNSRKPSEERLTSGMNEFQFESITSDIQNKMAIQIKNFASMTKEQVHTEDQINRGGQNEIEDKHNTSAVEKEGNELFKKRTYSNEIRKRRNKFKDENNVIEKQGFYSIYDSQAKGGIEMAGSHFRGKGIGDNNNFRNNDEMQPETQIIQLLDNRQSGIPSHQISLDLNIANISQLHDRANTSSNKPYIEQGQVPVHRFKDYSFTEQINSHDGIRESQTHKN